jgi:hypothetical protein
MLDNDKVAKVLLGDSAIYNFTIHFWKTYSKHSTVL